MSGSAALALRQPWSPPPAPAYPAVERPLLPPPAGAIRRRGLIRGRMLSAVLVVSAVAYVAVPAALLVSSTRPAVRARPAVFLVGTAAPDDAGQSAETLSCARTPGSPEGRLLQRAGAASCTPPRFEIELLSRTLPGLG